jgi:hypothetical protein
MRKVHVLFTLVLVLAVMIFSVPAMAAPIVSYSTSGGPMNWVLDFSVNNTLGDGNDVYILGVQPEYGITTGGPTGWFINYWPSWNNQSYFGAGSNITYYHTWYDPTYTLLPAGNTLSGFQVQVFSTEAPTSVPWFTASYGGSYYEGQDYIYSNQGYPLFMVFEGTAYAQQNAVPIPGALWLFGPGLVGLAGLRRRFSA